MKPTPLALLVSDLHFRHTPPSGRAESDWYPVMEARLHYLQSLKEQYQVPIVAAGDILDRHNPPAELLSFLIDHMPHMYTIPGQHDLANHDYESRMDHGYGVLCKAGAMTDLDAERWYPIRDGKVTLWAMPWGRYLPPSNPSPNAGVSLAVIHKYVWAKPNTKHAKAEMNSHITGLTETMLNLDAGLSGDNHIQFLSQVGGKPFFNHGGFIPQNLDQKSHKPCVGMLWSDKSISLLPFDASGAGNWAEESLVPSVPKLSASLVTELSTMESDKVDFGATVRVLATKAKRPGCKTILESLGK
jgi:hypothetical protein